MRDLGLSLRILRQIHRLKLREAGERAELSPTALSDYETGKSTPSLAALERILRAYRCARVTHAELLDFLQYLRGCAILPEAARGDSVESTPYEVHHAVLQIGQGVTRLILLGFRILRR